MTAKQICDLLLNCIIEDKKVLIIGNGGSASESHHMASEFMTHGVPAFSLCDDSTITALANDYSYEDVFSRQIEVCGVPGDILIGLSTSGKSKNILKAYKTAKLFDLTVIDWPRRGKDTASVQEYQLHLMHSVYKRVIELLK